jgi:UDP-N-acetylmuramoyl-L-alanyl-D-glutamate--2,6-diaminopimelate ligase
MKKFSITEILKQYKITDLAQDSRKVVPGAAFFALQGIKSDGNDYIDAVLEKGAKLVISDKISDEKRGIFKVENVNLALAESCKWFFKDIPNKLLAVTGTSGKTSVVSYISQILGLIEVPAATIGSLGIITNNCVFNKENDQEAQELNTQDLITFYRTLSALKKQGINIVAFEASSHGLEQGRMLGVKVDVVGFTSFSQDHLDYHGTMENYLQAKLKIFSNNLKDDGIAIINSDMSCTNQIKAFVKACGKRYLTVGDKGELKITKSSLSLDKQNIEFEYKDKEYNFETSVIGAFQASNILIAALMVASSGYDFENIVKILNRLETPNGRLEKIEAKRHIFIDHSHKPEALEKALNNLAGLRENGSRLIVVFGCGGNRDRIKRPIMGRIASENANLTIITDDNPRFEEADVIRQEILAGVENEKLGKQVIEIGDRREAIKHAITVMDENDILLIAGKGHETYQLIKDKKIPFSDFEIAKEIASELV